MSGFGAAGVIFDSHGRVLLVRQSHPEWEPEQEPFVPPGGGRAGETPRDAAEREIFEECGVVAKAGALLGVYVSRADDFLAFVSLAEITAGVPAVPPSGEIVEVGWFDPANLPTPCPSIATAVIADAASRVGVYQGGLSEAHPTGLALASKAWRRSTTCSWSAPGAPACARRSRLTTQARTSGSCVEGLHPTRSHSGAAEGGINAALGNAGPDDPETHTFDTVKGSDYLGDQDAIEILCREAPGDIYQLEHWGAFFSHRDDGRLAQRPFGAAGSPRTVYAADITGHVLIQVLYEQLCRRDITVYDEYFAWQLVLNDDRCQGVICSGPPQRRPEDARR